MIYIIDIILGQINTQPAIDIVNAAKEQIDIVADYIDQFTKAFIPVIIWYGIFKIVMSKT
jgi:hypothetical protein